MSQPEPLWAVLNLDVVAHRVLGEGREYEGFEELLWQVRGQAQRPGPSLKCTLSVHTHILGCPPSAPHGEGLPRDLALDRAGGCG